MDDYVWHLLLVAVGGFTVLLVAHFSRKSWIAEYGEKSTKDNYRFWACLVISYSVLTLIVYIYPLAFMMFAAILVVATQIGIGSFHLLNEKPGLRKDIIYGGAISTFLASITGVFAHAS